MKLTELEKRIFKIIGKFKNDFQLTYSEEALIDKVIENITEGYPPTKDLHQLTITEQLVIKRVLDYINRRINDDY